MCGICGILDFREDVEASRVQAMVDALHHRGPDGQGVYSNGPVGLGHTRLSIIDLSEAGAQPMRSANGTAVMTYNGELYNYREIRRELEGLGATFVGSSDSEVLLAAYMQWGPVAFRRFNGIFALAIWNSKTEELTLARDRFGIKPLYYRTDGDRTVFGSEIKALLSSKSFDSVLDYQGLHEFLYYRSPLAERTLFDGVKTVDPGSYMTIRRGETTTTRYWTPNTELLDVEEADAVVEIRRRLEAAVEAQMVADVPIGVFLSGGIDSSCIAALASRHATERLRTYSVGFDFSKGANELPAAKALATTLGTDHHELHVKGYDLGPVLEAMVEAHDHPFSDPANVPLYLLCRELGGSPKVILQGDGGDEIFAGYYRYSLLRSRLATNRAAAVAAGALSKVLPRTGRSRRAARVLEVLGQRDSGRRAALFMTSESPSMSPVRILTPEARERCLAHDPFDEYVRQDERYSMLDPVQRMLFTDSQLLLPNIYLEKVDRPTMANSMEVRVPLLDNEVTDYAMRLPTHLKIRRGEKKYLLRQALRGVVPDTILDAPKTGFSVPESYWLQTSLNDYMREVLLDRAGDHHGIIDRPAVEKLITEHTNGQVGNGALLWNTLNLALWLEQYRPQS